MTSTDITLGREVTRGFERFRRSPEYPDIEKYQKAESLRRARQCFAICRDETGEIEEPARWLKRDEQRMKSLTADQKTAHWLRSRGINPYRKPSNGGLQMYFYGIESKFELAKVPYRTLKVFTEVARERRSPHRKSLMELVQDNPARHRMWVNHDGARCVAGEVVPRLRGQKKRAREWNKSVYAERYQHTIVFSGCETGSPWKKAETKKVNPVSGRPERDYIMQNGERVRAVDEQGRQTWHPHTHMLVRGPEKPLSAEKFTELIHVAQKFFGVKMLDQGKIEGVDEVCKYLTKPDDFEGIPDDEREAYFWALKGFRQVETAGELRERIHARRDNQEMLRQKRERVTRHVNYNQKPISYEKTPDEKLTERATVEKGPGKSRLLAILPPMAIAGLVKEPVALILGRPGCGEFETEFRKGDIERIWLACRVKWLDANRNAEAKYGMAAGAAAARAAAGAAVFSFCSQQHRNCPDVGLGGSGNPPERSEGGGSLGGPPLAERRFLPEIQQFDTAEVEKVAGTRAEPAGTTQIFDFSHTSGENAPQKAETPVAIAAGVPLGANKTDWPWLVA